MNSHFPTNIIIACVFIEITDDVKPEKTLLGEQWQLERLKSCYHCSYDFVKKKKGKHGSMEMHFWRNMSPE